MARHRINDEAGKPTKLFWSDAPKHGTDAMHRTVFKETAEGIKRMKGVHFNPDKRLICKE